MLELALLAALGYGVVTGGLYAMQDAMIFPRDATPPPSRLLPPAAERLTLESADGHTLHGVYLPAARPGGDPGPIVLGFPGNAWNAQDFAVFMHERLPTADVVAYHYRGYPPSGGAPGERALAADAILAFDTLRAQVPDRQVILLGVSIGTGVAAHIAAGREPAGLVLITPFDSIRAVAGQRYWWAPVGALLRHPFDTAALLADRPVPTAVIRAGRDRLIRPERTAALTAQLRNVVYAKVIVDAGHSSIIDHPDFAVALREAVAAAAAASPGAPKASPEPSAPPPAVAESAARAMNTRP